MSGYGLSSYAPWDTPGSSSGRSNYNTLASPRNDYGPRTYETLFLMKQFFENLQFGLWGYAQQIIRNMFTRERNLRYTETGNLLRERHYFGQMMSKWYPHDRNLKPEMIHGPFRMGEVDGSNRNGRSPWPIFINAKVGKNEQGEIVPWMGFDGKGPVKWVWDGYR